MRVSLSHGEAVSARTARSPRVCVFCGARSGNSPAFANAARELGRGLAERGFGLVYGGGGVGLMGDLARAAVAGGGAVTGVIPRFLTEREAELEIDHELVVVADMVTRKRLMAEGAEAFIALPGGFGTIEEIVEQISWTILARHAKPIILLDIDGYWRSLCRLFDHLAESGFADTGWRSCVTRFVKVDEALDHLEAVIARSGGPQSPSNQLRGAELVEISTSTSRHDVYACEGDRDAETEVAR